MDERNPASQLSEGKKEGGEGGFSIFQPAPPPRLPFNPSLARSKVIGLGTYRSTPPLWFHSPRERESSAMVPTVQPFFFTRERKRSSAWNPSLPPSLFSTGHQPGTYRSTPQRESSARCPTVPPFFFTREREVIGLDLPFNPPLWFGHPERESHRPWCLPFDPLQRDLLRRTKKEPRLFFFCQPKNTQTHLQIRVSLQEEPEGSYPRSPQSDYKDEGKEVEEPHNASAQEQQLPRKKCPTGKHAALPSQTPKAPAC